MDWRAQCEYLEREQWENEFMGDAPAVDGRNLERKNDMAMMLKEGGGNFTPAPAGNHLARCYRIVELGTQRVLFKGKEKEQQKIRFFFELHGEDDEGNPLTNDDGVPLTISRMMTASLSEKGNLRPFLESWRGRAFTKEELAGFDPKNVLDKWCMLSVVHEEYEGKQYATIKSAAKVHATMARSLPAAVHPAEYFDITDPDMQLFESFYDKLKEQIRASLEWTNGSAPASAREEQKATATAVAAGFEDMDDDIPF